MREVLIMKRYSDNLRVFYTFLRKMKIFFSVSMITYGMDWNFKINQKDHEMIRL